MEREFSAGGVVVRQIDNQWWIAAIHPRDNNSQHSKRTVTALPKGIIDPGESPAEAAVREVREETGLEAALVSKLGDVKYVYVRSWGNREKVFKVVTFYLLRYVSGSIGDITPEMQHEVSGAEWIPLAEADRRLSYSGERQMLRLAREHIERDALQDTTAEKESGER